MFAFDGAAPMKDAGAALAGTTHLLSSVPPGAEGDPVLAWHADDIATISGLRWIGYLSTTGVYGDRQGGWVDEESPREPTGSRGERRVAAEDGWFALGARCGVPVQSFRLAGIYGPGRNALETVRSGNARRVVKPGQVFSRIHVDDIAAVLRASIARPHAGAAYNVCDDEAAPPETVIEYACELLGVDPPAPVAFEDAELSPMGRSFYRDNKRVSNRRIREELGVTLNWPNYREGLRGLLADC
jgi:nucleoside-diphosphate-sugar epimerase